MINRRIKTSLIILAVAAFWALLATARAGAAPLYFDNFDSYTAGACPTGWTCTAGAGATTTAFFSGSKSLAVDRGAANAIATSTSFAALAERVTVQFWWNVKYSQASASNATVINFLSSTGTVGIALRSLDSMTVGAQRFQWKNNLGTWAQICATPYTAGVWYRFKVITDPSQTIDKFDVYIYDTSGALVCSLTNQLNGVVENLNNITFTTQNTAYAKSYIDDLQVTKTALLNVTTAAANPAAATVSTGGVDVPMLLVNMAETNNQENVKIPQMKFTASGTANDLSNITAGKVCLYSDQGTPGQFDTLDVPVGTCTSYSADNGIATFSGLTETINAGTNKNYLLVYDLAGTAANASTFIANITPATTTITPYNIAGYTTDAQASATLATVTGAAITGSTMNVSTSNIAPPVLSTVMPAEGAYIAVQALPVTFTTDKNAWCRWSLADNGYNTIPAASDCAGNGTMNLSCSVTGLGVGPVSLSIACRDSAYNAQTSANNLDLSYTVDLTPPTAIATVNDGLGTDMAFATSSTTLSANWTASTDPNSDIAEYFYAIGTSSGATDVVDFTGVGTAMTVTRPGLTLIDGTTYFFTVKAQNGAGLFSTPASSNGVNVDSSPPPAIATVNDGLGADITATASLTTLSANWSPVADPQSGLQDYSYAIGATPGATNVVDFTSVGTATGVTKTGLTLVNQTVYYFTVIAQNNYMLKSAPTSSNGQMADMNPPTQSNWNPVGRTSTTSPAVALTLNKPGDCKWAFTDLGYASMTNICTGGGTVNISCAVSGLTTNATATVYFSCHDLLGNKDTPGTNTGIDYFVDTSPPVFAGVTGIKGCGSGCLALSWAAATDAAGSLPITYKVYKASSAGAQNFGGAPDATTTAAFAQVNGLTDDTNYYFVVRAMDSAGNTETNTVEITGLTTIVPTLTKYPNNPVLQGDGVGFDQRGIMAPSVYYDGQIFHLWYDGRDDGSNTFIGYAVSLDGVNWATVTGNASGGAVFDVNPNPTGFDSTSAMSAHVFADPPTAAYKYYNWYQGNRSDRPSTLRIGLAASNDGINWQRIAGPGDGGGIMDWGDPATSFDNYVIFAPSIMYENGMYKMWYSGMDQDTVLHNYFWRIGYATSSDGITWTKYTGPYKGALIDKGTPGDFDYPRADHPNVYKEGGIYKMIYSGFDNEDYSLGRYRLGFAASADGINWTKQPGAAPEGAMLDNGASLDSIIAGRGALQVINGNLHVWYEGWAGTGTQFSMMYANNSGVMPPGLTAISITASPAANVPPGTALSFAASCTYSGVNSYCGSSTCACTDAVAWHTDNPSVAQIDQLGGHATGTASGTARITASCAGVGSNGINIVVDAQPPAFAGIQSIGHCGSGCLDLNWSAAADPQNSIPITYYIYQTATSGLENYSTGTYATTSTTFRATGLTDRRNYYFVVRAKDSTGNMETNTVELRGMPLVTDPTPPTAVGSVIDGPGPADISVTGSLNTLSALWTAASDPESGIIAYWYAVGTTPGATDVANWTDAGNVFAATATGLTLSNEATYYWSVKARNGVDAFGPAASSNGVAADTAGPRLSIASPASGASVAGSVIVTGRIADITLSAWSLSYGPGASPAAFREIASGTAPITNAAIGTWNTTSLGGTYTLKLTASDAYGRSAAATVTVNIGNTISIGGVVPAFKWVMLSVPVQPNPNTSLSMFGSGNYKLYRWDPTAANSEATLQYIIPTTLAAGNGFWIKSYGGSLNYSYTGVNTDTTQSFALPIKSGWNQIGVPFHRIFPWASVQVKTATGTFDLTTAANMGLISTTMQSYNSTAGSWVQSDTTLSMMPQAGYFVRAYRDVSLLFGPDIGMPGGLARVTRRQYDYRVKISAAAAESADVDNYIGAAPGASDGYDPLDAEEAPRSMDEKYTSLYFPRQDMPVNPGNYANDIRATVSQAGAAQDWNFNIDTNETGKTVTLTWDNAGLPADRYTFTLINLDNGDRIDMAAQNSYSYTAAGASVSEAHFKVEAVKKNATVETVSYTLSPGWNLVSVPIDPDVTGALAQLGDDLPMFSVYQFAGNRFYAADKADIEAGTGFWVWVNKGARIGINGVPVAPGSAVTVPLTAGWNVVGDPFGVPLPWGDNITVTCGGAAKTLSLAAAAGDVSSSIFKFDGQNYAAQGLGSQLELWRGYLLKAAAACELKLAQ